MVSTVKAFRKKKKESKPRSLRVSKNGQFSVQHGVNGEGVPQKENVHLVSFSCCGAAAASRSVGSTAPDNSTCIVLEW